MLMTLEIIMKKTHRFKLQGCLVLACVLFPNIISADDSVADSGNTLVVTAELEDSNLLDLASSVTVIEQSIIQNRNAQHLADLLNLAPNVNFATGASRGRFIQIRGIGERSEFREPVNYSVGVVLDGIDLTGIATAATTLDLQQVEILRGPQGTLYGANGLAGLINLVSNAPTDSLYSKLSLSVEEFSGRELSAVISGPISAQTGYRFAIKHYQSDGYMKNNFSNSADTNNLDELSVRGKLVSEISENITLTTSLFLVDIDNGYDAFSLDSNRTTLSDQPGFDRQKTKAFATNINWDLNEKYWLETVVSLADSELDYAYDEDWSHTGICDNTACDSDLFGFDWWYSSFDQYTRDNKNTSLDIRLHSRVDSTHTSNWVAGFYFRDQQVDLLRQYTFETVDFTSELSTKNIAAYGQLETPVSSKLSLTTGLRLEQRRSRYNDNNNVNFSPKENLWGGKFSLKYNYTNKQMIYGLVSRGYKNGGFNADATIEEEDRLFDTEFMWNYEVGVKGLWLDNHLTLQASLFFQDRKNIQTKQSIVRSLASSLTVQNDGICPCSFTDLTQNAASGSSRGIEIESQFQLNDQFDIYATLGLLDAKFDSFSSFSHVDANQEAIPPVPVNLDGRAVAHAPRYQAVVGAHFHFNHQLSFNLEVESKDEFFLSDRHNLKSNQYEILNLRLNYQSNDWRISAYVNNITNKNIKTRGFGSFGNDPRTFYERGEYFQFAAPRVLGLSISREFD